MKRVLGLLLLASWLGCGSADNAENTGNQVDPDAGVDGLASTDSASEASAEDEMDADQAKMLEGLVEGLQKAEAEGNRQNAGGIDFAGGSTNDADNSFEETGPSLSERLDGTLEQASDLGKRSLAGKGPLNAVLRAFTKAAGVADGSPAPMSGRNFTGP